MIKHFKRLKQCKNSSVTCINKLITRKDIKTFIFKPSFSLIALNKNLI